MDRFLMVVFYLMCAFLTFGHVYNTHECDSARNCTPGLDSAFFGAVWPLYWGGRAGIEVTK